MIRKLPRWSRAACLLLPIALSACLNMSTTDSLYSANVLPANAVVPELEADEAAAKKLAANAGFGSIIPLLTGYFGGIEVKYWDFGELPSANVKPMYIFRFGNEPANDGGHPPLIDAIPGDSAYTPLRQLYVVDLNIKTYRGERITSLRALEDAADMGLVSAPEPSEYFMNCVVVPSSAQLQFYDDGRTETLDDAYYRGKIVKQYCAGGMYANVGAIELDESGRFKPGIAYSIRRRSDASELDETLLDVDINDDGDLLDTNTIFNDNVETPTYSGVWNSFEVDVDRSWNLGDAKQESDLFDKDGDRLIAKSRVLDFRDRGVLLNRPIRWLPQ
jgi:hypothetical protein